jgi:hypothetical protein
MPLTIEGNRATLDEVPGRGWLIAASEMEGMKKYLKGGGVSFEPTPWNLELFKKHLPDIEIIDRRSEGKIDASLGSVGEGVGLGLLRSPTLYRPFRVPYAHQKRANDKFDPLPYFALFAEQGTGKTKIIIDRAGKRWCDGVISAVLVITLSGVHNQWIDEQFPEHIGETSSDGEKWERIPWRGQAWNKNKPKFEEGMLSKDKLAVFAINIDALRTDKGFKAAKIFIEEHGGKLMCVCDESQEIAKATSLRAEAARELSHMCVDRGISTGTPIGKDLTNYWAQFLFLSEEIIGHRYEVTFKTQYCIIGGWDGNTVVGSKNQEKLYERTEPYTFRATKEEDLQLPPKVYDRVYFDMTEEQWKAYRDLREEFLHELESGDDVVVKNAAVLLTRLQQITCGYLVDENEKIHRFKSNPRMDALLRLRESRPGKRIIWARFNEDVEEIARKIGSSAVAYYGGTSPKDRPRAKEIWLDPSSGIDDFVASPAAGGTGLNLQGLCRTNIYYSNSFNAIHRWQSEDRTHRIGTTGTVSYFDLIANKTVDLKVLSNLRQKKSLSDLMLDDIRKMLND